MALVERADRGIPGRWLEENDLLGENRAGTPVIKHELLGRVEVSVIEADAPH